MPHGSHHDGVVTAVVLRMERAVDPGKGIVKDGVAQRRG